MTKKKYSKAIQEKKEKKLKKKRGEQLTVYLVQRWKEKLEQLASKEALQVQASLCSASIIKSLKKVKFKLNQISSWAQKRLGLKGLE